MRRGAVEVISPTYTVEFLRKTIEDWNWQEHPNADLERNT